MARRLPRPSTAGLSRLGASGRGVTETGWGLVTLGLTSWLVGDRYHWPELLLLAAVTAIVLALGLVVVLVPRPVHADLQLRPARVTVGETATAQVDLRGSGVRLLPPAIEVPLGEGRARRSVGAGRTAASARNGTVRLEIDLPTTRRGVVEVGPATHVRTDPLGLFRRRREVSGTHVLHVRPVIAPLPSLASGIVHDLEGVASNKLAASDLSFHALREYVPGDDPRHVHWKSTARAGSLLVRQFQLTRRSHATVLLDPSPRAYAGEDEFELAVSVATSMALRALADDYEITFGCGDDIVTTREPQIMLDLACRVHQGSGTLKDTGVRVATEAGGTSLVVVVSGGRSDPTESRHAVAHFPSGADSFLVRADLAAEPRAVRSDTHTTVAVGALGQLSSLLVRAAS